MPQSSQTAARISASPAFYTLATSIDPRIPSDAAAQMLADFRNVVREATLQEVAGHFDQLAEREPDQGYRARVMRGAANDVRRLGRATATPTEAFVPRTERSYWQAIAYALNAAESVGMAVGIDLDGTLTDHNAWSVIWDRDAKQWVLAGYDAEAGAR